MGAFFVSDIGSLNPEIMSDTAVLDIGLEVVVPVISIIPSIYTNPLKTFSITAHIDRGRIDWQENEEEEHADRS
jgi:hypothetical protein